MLICFFSDICNGLICYECIQTGRNNCTPAATYSMMKQYAIVCPNTNDICKVCRW